jgi:hypothetical protein
VSTSLTIGDVPDEAIERLATAAAANGQSPEEYLRYRLIELAETSDVETWLAAVRARKSLAQSRATADQILGHRDAGRQ